MPRQSLELVLRAEDAEAVEAQWRALADAGLPSQADHRSATNAPHLTLVSAAVIPPEALELAATEIAPLLPLPLRVHGVVWLGARRPVLALLLHPPVELTTVVERVRDLAGDEGPRPWLPHLTLGRSVHWADLGSVAEALPQPDGELTAGELRHWDPQTATVTRVAPVAPDMPTAPDPPETTETSEASASPDRAR